MDWRKINLTNGEGTTTTYWIEEKINNLNLSIIYFHFKVINLNKSFDIIRNDLSDDNDTLE